MSFHCDLGQRWPLDECHTRINRTEKKIEKTKRVLVPLKKGYLSIAMFAVLIGAHQSTARWRVIKALGIEPPAGGLSPDQVKKIIASTSSRPAQH